MTITAHTGHADALDGAEFVILSIEVPPREALWKSDWEIPLRHGVRQPYAENGGPGGFAHTARNLEPIMQIVRDMEQICPDALLINFTNPMQRICDAVTRYSTIRCVGLCHQIIVGYAVVGLVLADELGIDVQPGFTTRTPRRSTNAAMQPRGASRRPSCSTSRRPASTTSPGCWMCARRRRARPLSALRRAMGALRSGL